MTERRRCRRVRFVPSSMRGLRASPSAQVLDLDKGSPFVPVVVVLTEAVLETVPTLMLACVI